MRPGPIPKRSDERRRRNAGPTVTQVEVEGPHEVPVPRLRAGLHPLAVAWFQSLGESAQSRFYEPSDWMTAVLAAEVLDEWMRVRTSSLLATLNEMAGTLMTTEGARRRLRIELERATGEPQADIATIDDYRRRLGLA